MFDALTFPETASTGEVVTVELVVSYDFDTTFLLSPGVFDPVGEEYITEEFVEVTGTGTEEMSLSFNAPSVEGEYVFIVDMYYQNGTDWYSTGQEDYYITLTVGQSGGSTATGSAVVKNINYPSVVNPEEAMEIGVTIEYDFLSDTNMEIAVTDPETMEAIETLSAVRNGVGTDEFKLTIYAPDEEGSYTLGADVIFETVNGWEFSDGGVMVFTFEVDADASSGSIPSFPVISIIMGLLGVMGLLQIRGRKNPQL